MPSSGLLGLPHPCGTHKVMQALRHTHKYKIKRKEEEAGIATETFNPALTGEAGDL